MDKKTKDCAFAAGLILFSLYVLYEGLNIIERASKPPFNIKSFGISPGMMPVVLAVALFAFSGILLFYTLRGETNIPAAFFRHLRAAVVGAGRAVRVPAVRRMAGGMLIMGLYSFFGLGDIPFWIGASIFLVVLMGFLRASKPWVIVIASGTSVALILVLFQILFKTSLP